MVQQSLVKRTREAKKNAGIATLAMKIARDKDDIQYKKAKRFKALFVAAKQAVNKKFAPQAKMLWVKMQSEKKQ